MTRFLAKLYAFKFFDSFILIVPLYAVMFVDAGLSARADLGGPDSLVGDRFVLQIPSGVIADRWSRRHILAGAQLARAAGFVVWLFYPHFWGFLAGLVLWGVKSAFTSGTFEALLYDELKAQGRAHDYTRIYRPGPRGAGRRRGAGRPGRRGRGAARLLRWSWPPAWSRSALAVIAALSPAAADNARRWPASTAI